MGEMANVFEYTTDNTHPSMIISYLQVIRYSILLGQPRKYKVSN